jgi:hypothetical protein
MLIVLFSVCFIFLGGTSAFGAPILFEWASNVDGTMGMEGDVSSFDQTTGLGTITFTIGGAGDHFVGLFVDHEYSEANNTFFNENGIVNGTLEAGQSWEIDEPGYIFGDIYWNFEDSSATNSLLDNTNALPFAEGGAGEDVSMALGWNFNLAVDETATISFILSENLADITSAFYLGQMDPSSNELLYFGSTMRVNGNPVPEPATLLLLGTGLMGLCAAGRKRIRAKK